MNTKNLTSIVFVLVSVFAFASIVQAQDRPDAGPPDGSVEPGDDGAITGDEVAEGDPAAALAACEQRLATTTAELRECRDAAAGRSEGTGGTGSGGGGGSTPRRHSFREARCVNYAAPGEPANIREVRGNRRHPERVTDCECVVPGQRIYVEDIEVETREIRGERYFVEIEVAACGFMDGVSRQTVIEIVESAAQPLRQSIGELRSYIEIICRPTETSDLAVECDQFRDMIDQDHASLATLIAWKDRIDPVVRGMAQSLCGITSAEINAGMTAEEVARRCGSHRGSGSGADERWLRFQLGVGGRLMYHGDTMVVSGYGVVFAQWEPMAFSENAGFYLRALVGYGTLGDAPGRYGQVPIGESGLWGFSLGGAWSPIREITLNFGVVYNGSLIEGMRGRATGDYRWHFLGGEIRLRGNVTDWFALEATIDAGWSHSERELPNQPNFVGGDGGGVNGMLGVEFTLN